MKSILLISKDSGQTRKFMQDLPEYIETSGAELEVELVILSDYVKAVGEKEWAVIALSPEVLAEEEEIRAKLKDMQVRIPIILVNGFNFGMRRFDRIFSELLR